VLGCDGGGKKDTDLEAAEGRPPPLGIASCATPAEGCPCTALGQTVPCGEVERIAGDYVSCSLGTRTCLANGRWGACMGVEVRSKRASSLSPRSLGSSGVCIGNPCDPYCSQFLDTGDGIDAGLDSGLEALEGGISIVGSLSGGATPCTGLTIDPPVQTLSVTKFAPPQPNELAFTAKLTPAGCYPGNVAALWSIDRFDIATIDANGKLTLVTPIAGPIDVRAYVGGLAPAMATANVVVDVHDTQSAPTGYGAAFPATTGAADALTILYPYAGTVLPLGLLPPIPQWSASTSADAVKVTLRYSDGTTKWFDWSTILPENQALPLNPGQSPAINLAAGKRAPNIPAAVWSAFERSAKGNDAAIVLQRHAGGRLRAEVPTPIHFATGQLKGSVYYQSYGTNLVRNFGTTYATQTIGASQRFGAATLRIRPGANVPTVAAGSTSAANGPGCRVCHSAAALGGALVTNRYEPNDYVSNVFDMTPATPVETLIPDVGGNANDGRYAWGAVYPDGSFLFSNSGVPRSSSTPAPGGLQGGDNGGPPQSKLYSLASGTLGTTIASSGIPSSLRAAMPVFSPDGKHIAFNHYGAAVAGTSGDKRSLAMMDFDAATRTFSNFRRIVNQPSTTCNPTFHPSDPCTNVWPTFLPSSDGVVFEKEIFNNGRVSGANHSDFGGTRSGCDGSGACADDGTKAELWWTSTGATPTAARLDRANGRDVLGGLAIPTGGNGHTSTVEGFLDYEPTVNPQPVGGYIWVMFTSRRLYGNIATMNPWWSDPRYKPIGGDNGPTTKKLWVAAIKASPTPGQDPSYPAFYLPGQEYLAGNSKGFWVLDACKAASATRTAANECDSNLDCCGAPQTAICSLQTPVANPPKRHCVPVGAAACVADGGTCTLDSECCNFAAGARCASGVCQTPPPVKLYYQGDFMRDFEAKCPPSHRAVWRFFDYQAVLPSGTSIDFHAATADTPAGLSAATPLVFVGTASPPSTTTWTSFPATVDQDLKAAGTQSKNWLRVFMHLQASSDHLATPVLTQWRQQYDCLPTE
jgi:hypothetical protein